MKRNNSFSSLERLEFSLPKEEEKILKFWNEHRIFDATLASRKREDKTLRKTRRARVRGKKHFVFFEGPPYANGKPGIHHVLARIYKDIILRYKTMRGYSVPRRAGWDTHGLPVEIAAEKALGLKSKKEIEKFGVARFNEEAKKAVWRYRDEWERMTERIGYWLDFKNAYVTYAPEYIENLWRILAQIAKRPTSSRLRRAGKLLYKGFKVVPWCARCGTALSSHELALGYKEVDDKSVYVKFHLKQGQRFGKYTTKDRAYILSWTTTPWTLPGNVALAVGEEIKYVILESKGEKSSLTVSEESHPVEYAPPAEAGLYIFNPDVPGIWGVVHHLLDQQQQDDLIRIQEGTKKFSDMRGVRVVNGKDLINLEYEPLFDIPALKTEKSYKIYAANFVTTTDGTGVVHTAVMYGEDDYALGVKVGLPQHHTVAEDGTFTKDAKGFAGLPVKAQKTEEKIFKHLEDKGLLLRTEAYRHEYPFCWRCDSRVLYFARTSWFIAMSKLRKELLKRNETINWVPAHLRRGRFGEWLKEVKDWNLSRERYWGTPLPVWECGTCGAEEIIGNLKELDDRAGGARNEYWIMRHGEATSNITRRIDAGGLKSTLTLKGRVEAETTAKFLKKINFDLIIASPLARTRETGRIVAEFLGVKKVFFDARLREIQLGVFQGCHDFRYHEAYPRYEDRFLKRPEKGESLRDVRRRVWEFLHDIEKKHRGKKILIVSHEYPIWMLFQAGEGWSETRAIHEKEFRNHHFIATGEARSMSYHVVPRDPSGEIDLHRPFADQITFACRKCAGAMSRVKEVVDVWFDSGAMPFAQGHWLFGAGQQPATSNQLPAEYPADYIAEGMDQTRGWFYTMLAVATALGQAAPYKNVVSLGLINDTFGQKMSKSKGNIVEPFEIIEKYGTDAVRWYFYTINPPGENKNFDEQDVAKAFRRFHLMLYHCLVFYRTYHAGGIASTQPSLRHVLDQWIVSRLHETIASVTRELDAYAIRDAAMELERFADDLSRWYIRRSRRRFQKPVNKKDHEEASRTLGAVLQELTKLIAPFTPFFAEILYRELNGHRRSVHLEDWAKTNKKLIRKELLDDMRGVRQIASMALARRAELRVKVRQPLAELRIADQRTQERIFEKRNDILKKTSMVGESKPLHMHERIGTHSASRILKHKELTEILKEEVNVKRIVLVRNLEEEIEFDTTITPELKEEGMLRELVRMVQELRQKAGVKANDSIVLMVHLPENLKSILSRNELFFKKEVGAKEIQYKKSSKFAVQEDTKIEGEPAWLGLRKA